MNKTSSNQIINGTLRHARRVIVAIIGITVLLIGMVMIVLPGPAIIVIPLGLSILAIEFVWAKKLLHRIKESKNSLFKNTK